MNNYTPPKDCAICPRLVGLRHQCQSEYPDWFNAPVPSFGDLNGQLAIIGLAPGKKGANRTGRPFTGDYAGFLLYETLLQFQWAMGEFKGESNDGLQLVNCRIMNAVKCLPPDNKPTPDEIRNCAPFLTNEINQMPNLRVILALGHIAHDTIINHFGLKRGAYKFAHGRHHNLPNGYILVNSYHCSRYNTQTNRLTPAQFRDIFANIQQIL